MQRLDSNRAAIHPEAQYEILFRNRKRCCVCRNPAKPVHIYQINSDQYLSLLENLIAICQDCYSLASSCKGESGDEYFKKELIRYKQIWERECNAWRNDPNYSIRVNQEEWQDDVYGEDWVLIGSYKLDIGKEFGIDLKSDEPVMVEIRKEYSNGELSDETLMESEIGFEFSLTFTPERSGYYAVLIEKKSDEKTTVELISPEMEYGKAKVSILNEESSEQTLRSSSLSSNEAGVKDSTAEFIPWRILPPGEHPFPHILEYCEYLKQNNKKRRVVEERINLIGSLNPTNSYVGIDEFNGYFVFYFRELDTAVLDSPEYGNAIYVIRGDWKALSKLSKAELLKGYQNNVDRVIHSGDWFAKLRKLIHDKCNRTK